MSPVLHNDHQSGWHPLPLVSQHDVDLVCRHKGLAPLQCVTCVGSSHLKHSGHGP